MPISFPAPRRIYSPRSKSSNTRTLLYAEGDLIPAEQFEEIVGHAPDADPVTVAATADAPGWPDSSRLPAADATEKTAPATGVEMTQVDGNELAADAAWCPTCGVAAGEQCLTPKGKPARKPHSARAVTGPAEDRAGRPDETRTPDNGDSEQLSGSDKILDVDPDAQVPPEVIDTPGSDSDG